MQMRERLSKDRRLSQFYLVDAILAELRSGHSLNGELFAQLKSVTILAVLALSHQFFSGIAEAGPNGRRGAAQRQADGEQST